MTARIGLIGAGDISGQHAAGWRAVSDRARVVAVADPVPAAAAGLAARFDARTYESYVELLDRERPDAIDVCVPPDLHHEIVLAAAARGINVLCEKPLAPSLEAADSIGAAISSSGIIYVAAHNSVFYPTVRWAAEAIGRGDIGRPMFARSWECSTDVAPARLGVFKKRAEPHPGLAWRGDPGRLGGGALIDGGYHAVYRLLYLVGTPVTQVSAMLGHMRPDLGWSSEDTAAVLVRFADGAIGEITISYAFDAVIPGARRIFSVVGGDGTLAGDKVSIEWLPRGWTTPASVGLDPDVDGDPWGATFRAEISHFVDVLDGRCRPLQSFTEARRALVVVSAAYESVSAGRTVTVSEDDWR